MTLQKQNFHFDKNEIFKFYAPLSSNTIIRKLVII